MTVTPTDLQVSLDDITVHSEMTRECADRPTLCVELGQQFVILCGELGDHASPHVHRGGDGFKMGRVHAQSDSAKMIGPQALRPRPYSFFPDGSVSDRLFPPKEDLAVSTLSDSCSRPYPAGRSKTPVFDLEVTLVYQTNPLRHTDTSYHQHMTNPHRRYPR